MLDLLDVLGGCLELLFSWRFYVSVASSLVIVAVRWYSPLGEPIRLWASIGVVLMGVIGGMRWEYKATGRLFN